MKVKCKKCDREFSEEPTDYPGKVYVHQDEVMCEDCLVQMGVLPDHDKSADFHLFTEQAMFLQRKI